MFDITYETDNDTDFLFTYVNEKLFEKVVMMFFWDTKVVGNLFDAVKMELELKVFESVNEELGVNLSLNVKTSLDEKSDVFWKGEVFVKCWLSENLSLDEKI